MRSMKMDVLALEEALGFDDFEPLSASPEIRSHLDDVSDEDADTIGLRRLLERPEALSASLPRRLWCAGGGWPWGTVRHGRKPSSVRPKGTRKVREGSLAGRTESLSAVRQTALDLA